MRLLGAWLLARRLLAAVLCHWDIHDTPKGFRRVALDEVRWGAPWWFARCPWCGLNMAVQAEPDLDRTARDLARSRRAS